MANQKEKKKRKLPKDITKKPDREVMEKLFGKRVVKELDKLTSEEPEDREPKED
jgi:hypothetical protein